MSNWIKVEDALPPSNGDRSRAFYDFSPKVLVFRNGRIEMGFFDHGLRRWRVLGVDGRGVTHWMPLPEKP